MPNHNRRQMKLDNEEFYHWKKIVSESKEFTRLMRKRNIKKQQTKNRYIVSLTTYCVFTNKSLPQLISEAKKEQKTIDEDELSIIDLLEEFRPWMSEKGLSNLTIRTRFNDVKTFYRNNRIRIPELERYNPDDEEQLEFSDLPTENDIERAIDSSTSLSAKALFYFVASSGTGKMETSNITVQDFIDATRDYHGEINNIDNVLAKLESQEDVVPLFKLTREKTGNIYHTCCTPQATKAILTLLRSKNNIKNDDPLFNYKYGGISKAFQRANIKHGWPKIKNYYYFGCHRLRKRHASLLIRDKGLAHYLQGRVLDKTSRSYFFEEPKRVREEYKKYIPILTIGEAEYYGVSSEEYDKLQTENDKIRQNYEELEKSMEEQKEEYEQKIIKLEALNDALVGKVNNLEDQFNQLARSHDIEKIHKIASANKLVNEHNLMKSVMQIYNEDVEKDKNLFVDENYIESIISRAYNRKRNEINKWISGSSRDRNFSAHHQPQIESLLDTLKDIVEKHSKYRGFSISDYQKQEIDRVLWEYALKLAHDGLDEESIDKDEVIRIVNSILM